MSRTTDTYVSVNMVHVSQHALVVCVVVGIEVINYQEDVAVTGTYVSVKYIKKTKKKRSNFVKS